MDWLGLVRISKHEKVNYIMISLFSFDWLLGDVGCEMLLLMRDTSRCLFIMAYRGVFTCWIKHAVDEWDRPDSFHFSLSLMKVDEAGRWESNDLLINSLKRSDEWLCCNLELGPVCVYGGMR